MARKAKRYLTDKKSALRKKYMVGIYARLSVNTEERKSESLEHQVSLIEQFIEKYNRREDRDSDLFVYEIYKDLGKSGTNFERDGFEHLMRDVKSNKVNCIIVKDFSRFGRNYIEAGNYIQKILPFMQVRFISVGDGYDSDATAADQFELAMNIKNLVNDMYAKDISKKLIASRRISQKRGDYVGGVAPYGYRVQKCDDMYKLVVEPEAAEIVKWIFEEYANGTGIQQIINRLFERRVHRASDYRRYKHVYQQEGEILRQWGNSSVRAVLYRNTYYGDMVQHKYESGFSRGEKGCDVLDKSEWIIVPDTHEAIISKNVFERVQERLKKDKETRNIVGWSEAERAFYNVFYCGECGRKLMTKKSKKHVNYSCQAARYKDDRECHHKAISEEKLQKIVKSELIAQIQKSKMSSKNILLVTKQFFSERTAELKKETFQMEQEMVRIVDKSTTAFMKYKEGDLAQEAYLKMKEERTVWEAYFSERKQEILQMISNLEKQEKVEEKYLHSLLKINSKTVLNPELVETLIERIYLYGDGRLEINFKLKEGQKYGL